MPRCDGALALVGHNKKTRRKFHASVFPSHTVGRPDECFHRAIAQTKYIDWNKFLNDDTKDHVVISHPNPYSGAEPKPVFMYAFSRFSFCFRDSVFQSLFAADNESHGLLSEHSGKPKLPAVPKHGRAAFHRQSLGAPLCRRRPPPRRQRR